MLTNSCIKNSPADSGFKAVMEALCIKYRSDEALAADPISIPLGYATAIDREFVSWVAAHLAYGRVAPMLRAIRRLLEPMGREPVQWLRNRSETIIHDEFQSIHNTQCAKHNYEHSSLAPKAGSNTKHSSSGWVWRFHTLEDMVAWIITWKRLDESTGYSGIELLLVPQDRESADQRLSTLINNLRQSLPQSQGLRFNLPDPLKGAACKRWRMFLRWMARKGWPDFGIWKNYPQAELIIPLDTHVHRISRQIGICSRRAQDGKTALEITEALKKLNKSDPLKYDFAIAHLGILGDCTGHRRSECGGCPLNEICVVSY